MYNVIETIKDCKQKWKDHVERNDRLPKQALKDKAIVRELWSHLRGVGQLLVERTGKCLIQKKCIEEGEDLYIYI